MYIDILVIIDGKWIPIELKYKTLFIEKDDLIIEGEKCQTREQGAENENCYAYLKDVYRIEKLKDKYQDKFIKGYAIFLTNNERYKKGPKNDDVDYAMFSLKDQEKFPKHRQLHWKNNSKSKEKLPGFTINGEYANIFEWKNYSEIDNLDSKGNKFYYLITEIK